MGYLLGLGCASDFDADFGIFIRWRDGAFAAFEHTANRGKAAAILSIIGAVNLPIIKYSVQWWNTLHQGSTFSLTEAPKMSTDMWMPLLMMIIGSYLLVATLAIYRTNTLILYRDQGKAWVKEYIRGQHK